MATKGTALERIKKELLPELSELKKAFAERRLRIDRLESKVDDDYGCRGLMKDYFKFLGSRFDYIERTLSDLDRKLENRSWLLLQRFDTANVRVDTDATCLVRIETTMNRRFEKLEQALDELKSQPKTKSPSQ